MSEVTAVREEDELFKPVTLSVTLCNQLEVDALAIFHNYLTKTMIEDIMDCEQLQEDKTAFETAVDIISDIDCQMHEALSLYQKADL